MSKWKRKQHNRYSKIENINYNNPLISKLCINFRKIFIFKKNFKNYYKYIKINYNNMHDIIRIADYIIAFKMLKQNQPSGCSKAMQNCKISIMST